MNVKINLKTRLMWASALFVFSNLVSQTINGEVIDKSSKEAVFSCKVISSEGEKSLSDFDGKFQLKYSKLPVKIIISALGYKNDTINCSNSKIKIEK